MLDALLRTKQTDSVLFNVYRLAAAVGTMTKADDYFEFAELALRAGSPGEAQTALEEGKAKGVFADAKSQARLKTLTASVSEQVKSDQAGLDKVAKDAETSKTGQKDVGVAIAYLGYKQYDKAVESFKKGLAKPGVMNVPEANLLLGISALRAGKKDEAQAAFKNVKGDRGTRASRDAVEPARRQGVTPLLSSERTTAMTIKAGERMPSGTLKTMTKDGPKDLSTDELFKGKTGGAVLGAGRIHAHLRREASAGIRAERGSAARARASTPSPAWR